MPFPGFQAPSDLLTAYLPTFCPSPFPPTQYSSLIDFLSVLQMYQAHSGLITFTLMFTLPRTFFPKISMQLLLLVFQIPAYDLPGPFSLHQMFPVFYHSAYFILKKNTQHLIFSFLFLLNVSFPHPVLFTHVQLCSMVTFSKQWLKGRMSLFQHLAFYCPMFLYTLPGCGFTMKLWFLNNPNNGSNATC